MPIQLTGRTAISYQRVSSDEQAKGHSLNDQKELIGQFARRHEITLVERFSDDASARTRDELGESFNRPGFQAMLAWIRSHRGEADLLLFKDYSRFSRDATDALVMIRQLEALGIECQATEQPIDWSVPEQVPLLMLYIGMPEAENRRRGLNIKRGLRRAKREGRWVHTAPTGYKKAYDDNGKVYIVPDPKTAPLIREAFELAAEGHMTLEAIRTRLRDKSHWDVFFFNSRYRFGQMLRNRAYVGEIHLKAWRDEPEEWVEGNHEPLVSKALFRRVQRQIDNTPKGKKYILRDQLPLRGHLICPSCSDLWTGSGSRSHTGKRYWYYHCTSPCKERERADATNEAFLAYLSQIKLGPEVAGLFEDILCREIQRHAEAQRDRRSDLRTQRDELQEKLLRTDEAYIEERIAADSYERLKDKYQAQLGRVHEQLDQATFEGDALSEKVRYGLDLLARLDDVWRNVDTEARYKLTGSIFTDGLVFDGEGFRTPNPNELLYLLKGKNIVTYRNKKTGHRANDRPHVPSSGDAGSTKHNERS